MAQESLNPFEIAQRQFDAAADRLGLDAGLREILRTPKRQLVVSVPTLMDSGAVRVFEGYRVQHNTARGPALGGVRYQARLTLDGVKALAASSTWKCAVLGLPCGGSSGGVACDPKRLSRGELERVTRRFAAEISPLMGADRDAAAPDLATDAQTMAWIFDTHAATSGGPDLGAVTGKPIVLGGGSGRSEAAARGALLCVREACQVLRKPLRGATVAIQGWGNTGRVLARLLHGDGARVVAASDSRGGAYSSRGLDPAPLDEHKRQTGSIVGFRGAERITNEELLETKCDILVPAALEGQIGQRNASRVRCRIVAEAAHGAVTPTADRVLQERGVFVVPDLVCGAGGVVGSYLEWAQNRQGFPWDEAEVGKQAERLVRRAFQEAHDAAKRHRVDLRGGAHLLAVARVADAVRVRGLFP